VGRDIAIKELLSSVTEAASVGGARPGLSTDVNARFLREARVTGQLEHPSVMPVYEIGRRSDGTLYYAMRLVRGRSLAAAIAEAPDLRQRLLLLPHYRDICNAIAYAHSRGVIHRDIKPENVMLGEFGETVVLDWGLAKVKGQPDRRQESLEQGLRKLKDHDGGRTVDGAAMGTPHYMSPEQARGQVAEVDHQSDIYSLGAVLYEILAGAPPYDGRDAMAVLSQVINAEPPVVTEREPAAPTELVAVAHKAISRRKSERYDTATELSADVGAYMAGERVAAYEYTGWEVFGRFVRRHLAVVSAVVVVFLALVATAVVSSVYYGRERDARKQELRAKHRVEAASAELQRAMRKEVAERRQAQYRLSQALVEKALRVEQSQRFAAARIYAAAALINNPAYAKSPHYEPGFARRHPAAADLKVRAISLLFRSARLPSLRLSAVTFAGSRQQWQALSATRMLAAAVNTDGSVMIWRLGEKKALHRLSGHPGGVWQSDFSPAGDALVTVGRDGKTRIWDTHTGKVQATFSVPRGKCRTVSWSPAGRHIAIGNDHGDVFLWDWPARRFVGRMAGRGSVIFSQGWSADGTLLANVFYDKTLRIWTIPGPKVVELPRSQGPFHAAAFSPDGATLATTDWVRNISIWSTRPYRRLRSLRGHEGPVLGLAFTADGMTLVSGGFDRMLMVWNLATGARRVALEAHGERLRKIRFFWRDQRLVTLAWDRTVKTWALRAGRPSRAAVGHTDYVTGLKFSPDGRFFASSSSDRTVRIWHTATGLPKHVMKGHTDQADAVAWSSDGAQVVSACRDRTVRIWDAATGAPGRVLVGHKTRVNSVGVSPDNRWIASADHYGQVRLWNRRTGQLIQVVKAHNGPAWEVAFSPDSRLLASVGSDHLVKIWQTGTWRLSATLKGHTDWVSGVRFSSDGRLLASSGKDRRTIVWDLRTRRPVHSVTGHLAWTNRVLFSRDGRIFLTGSDDHTVRVWSTRTGEPLLIIPARRSVAALDMAPDSRTIILADDRVARIIPVNLATLEVDPRAALRQAEKAAGLKLTGFTLTPARGW